ncbi:MAG: hypothetical protein ACM3O9_09595 [Methylocystaceae bacterium]
MEKEIMMLESDLWLRDFIDEAIKGMDANIQAAKKEVQQKEAA